MKQNDWMPVEDAFSTLKEKIAELHKQNEELERENAELQQYLDDAKKALMSIAEFDYFKENATLRQQNTELVNEVAEEKKKRGDLLEYNGALRHENSKTNDELSCLRQQRDDLLAALHTINKWLGTDDGCYMLPLEPPWYTQMREAIASVEAADAATD